MSVRGVEAAEACAVTLHGSWVCVWGGHNQLLTANWGRRDGGEGLYCVACMWRWGEGGG